MDNEVPGMKDLIYENMKLRAKVSYYEEKIKEMSNYKIFLDGGVHE